MKTMRTIIAIALLLSLVFFNACTTQKHGCKATRGMVGY
jgi:hypothetical protein